MGDFPLLKCFLSQIKIENLYFDKLQNYILINCKKKIITLVRAIVRPGIIYIERKNTNNIKTKQNQHFSVLFAWGKKRRGNLASGIMHEKKESRDN